MYYLPVSISNMSISCIQPVRNKTVQNFLPVIFPFSTLSMCCVLERMDNLNYLFFLLLPYCLFLFCCLVSDDLVFCLVLFGGFVCLVSFCLFDWVFLLVCFSGLLLSWFGYLFFFFKKGNWRCLLKN